MKFVLRICRGVIYYPVIVPLQFLADLEDKYRIRRCLKKCERLLLDPKTDRERLLETLETVFLTDDAEKLADLYFSVYIAARESQ
jgi:hypothetical protein